MSDFRLCFFPPLHHLCVFDFNFLLFSFYFLFHWFPVSVWEIVSRQKGTTGLTAAAFIRILVDTNERATREKTVSGKGWELGKKECSTGFRPDKGLMEMPFPHGVGSLCIMGVKIDGRFFNFFFSIFQFFNFTLFLCLCVFFCFFFFSLDWLFCLVCYFYCSFHCWFLSVLAFISLHFQLFLNYRRMKRFVLK